MYKEHPNFVAPNDESTLWRYLDFTKFIALLETSNLYFNRSDKFSDIFEGIYPQKSFEIYGDEYLNVVLQNGTDPDVADGALASIKQSLFDARKYMAMNCWHMNEYESAAMWGLYLKSSEGIAIKSKFSRLRNAFAYADEDVNIGAVNYIDYDKDIINFSNSFIPFLCKRKSFEHEREVRAIIWKPNIKGSAIDYTEDTISHGLNVRCDLSSLVESIYVAPNAPGWFKHLVRDVIRRYGYNWDVNQSKLDDNPFY